MRIRGIGRVRKIAARLRKRPSSPATILAYHRIADMRSDPWGLAVSPRHFEEHLDVLVHARTVLPMRELVHRLGDGTLPQGAVALTFDDGYADNLLNAKPILERHGVPATVFIATGYVGGKREFWWDRLRALVLEPGTLPRKLSMAVNGLWYERDLGDDAECDEASVARHRSWRFGEPPPTARHELYQSLWQILRPLPDATQHAVLDQIRDWAALRNGRRQDDRTVSEEELVALANGGLVEIGAHTVTHPLLSALPEAAQHEEIYASRVVLEGIAGERVTSFAYPYGDHSPTTASIVARIGFATAVTTDCLPLSGQSLRFHLPRIVVDDFDGERFSRWLDEPQYRAG